MSNSETPPTDEVPKLTTRALLELMCRWDWRFAKFGLVIGAVVGLAIPLPYTDFLAQIILKSLLGAILGVLVGSVGAVVHGLCQHRTNVRTKVVGALFACACVGMFWLVRWAFFGSHFVS